MCSQLATAIRCFLVWVVLLGGCSKKVSPDLAAARMLNESTSTFISPMKSTEQSKRRVIIFVHGILGDAQKAWVRSDDSSGGFVRLLQSHPATKGKYDIFLFGFPSDLWKSGSFTLSQAADKLRRETAGLFEKYEEVYFVAHSMGGLVVLEFLTTNQELLPKVPVIVTYSSPFGGAPQIVDIAKHVLNNRALENMASIEGNDQLVSLHNRWKRIKETKPYAPRVKCAYETADFPGLGRPIVNFSQSASLCDGVPAPIHENHIDIVKPRKDTDAAFSFLIESLAEDLPGPPRMSITRVADFRGSVCDSKTGTRRYSEILLDTFVFSHRMQNYSLKTVPDQGMDVTVFAPRGSTDPSTWTKLSANCECANGVEPCSKKTCTWDDAVQVENRIGQVKWIWTSNKPQYIEGVSVKGRLPISAVNFLVQLPPDIKLHGHSVSDADFSCAVEDQGAAGIKASCASKIPQTTTADTVTLRLALDAQPCRKGAGGAR
jgi:pimeloyl-ACP methyl ester carboxylesterase